MSAKIERQVGQLNFFDFVASVDLEDNTADVGNPSLVPPQTWLLELDTTITLQNLGVITLRGYREFITDIVDQIPIGDSGEAPGNIDSADRYDLSTTTTLHLDRFGLEGVRTNIEADYQVSRVEDPLTGEVRRISGDRIAKLDLELRHDIPATNYAWGVMAERNWYADRVRLNQVSLTDREAQFNTFIEHKDLFGMTVRMELQDLSQRSSASTREFYAQRRTAPLTFREQSQLKDGYGVIFSIRGNF